MSGQTSLLEHGDAQRGVGLSLLQHHAGKDGSANATFASRVDTMFLGSLRPQDMATTKIRSPRADTQALRTHDLPGARPCYPHKALYTTGLPPKGEIPGTTSRTHYPEVNKQVDLSMTTWDIEKARPSSRTFKTNRCVNPLTPRYELPSYVERPPTPPGPSVHQGKARDTLEFKGAHTPRILERNYARDPNESRDIEGTMSATKTASGKFTPRDFSKTVEKAGERILSTKTTSARQTNPLQPKYDLCQRSTHPFRQGELSANSTQVVGEVDGSSPRQLHRDNGEPQASLIRRDIPGAVPQRFKGTLPFNLYDPPEVTPVLPKHLGLDVDDIDGAQTGTRKEGAWMALGHGVQPGHPGRGWR